MDFDNHRNLLPAYSNLIRNVEEIENNLNLCADMLNQTIGVYNQQMQTLIEQSNAAYPNFDAIEIGGISASNSRVRVYTLSGLARDLQRRLEEINRMRAIVYPNLLSCPTLTVNGVRAARIVQDLRNNYDWDGNVVLEEVPADEVDEVNEILEQKNFVDFPIF